MRPRDRQFRRLIDRAVRRNGGPSKVTIRRRHSLVGPVAGRPPAELALVGVHPEGSTSLTLSASHLAGQIVPGIRLTLGGQTVETTTETRAKTQQLTDVGITPALEGDVGAGATVTVEPYREYSFRAMASRRVEELEDGAFASGEQSLLLSASGAPTTPRRDDLLVLGDLPEEIRDVEPIQPGDTPWGWRVRRGGRAA